MNNKGFTLIELLLTLVIITVIMLIITFSIKSTLSLSNEKSYEILKNNIIDSANLYVIECESNTINCENNYEWVNNKTSFSINNLLTNGYINFEKLINPINGKDLSNCLIINVSVNINNVYTIELDDTKC